VPPLKNQSVALIKHGKSIQLKRKNSNVNNKSFAGNQRELNDKEFIQSSSKDF